MYMYIMDLALNNLQWLLHYKTKPNQTTMSCSSYLNGIGGKWPYSCCFVRCCFLDLFKHSCVLLI